MAAITVRPATLPAEPIDKFQEILKNLQEQFSSKRTFTYCNGKHVTTASQSQSLFVEIEYSKDMQRIATTTFELLQKAARSGKTSETLAVTDPYKNTAITSAVLFVFQEKLSLQGFNLGSKYPDTHPPLCPGNREPFS